MKKLLSLLVLLLCIQAALACSCAFAGVEEHIGFADSIFQAKVTHVDVSLIGSDSEISLDPSSVWKGEPQRTIFTAESSASCGYSFAEGEEYIIFAKESEGRYATGICSGTVPVNEETLAALGDGTPVVTEPVNFFGMMSLWQNVFWIGVFILIVVVGLIWHVRVKKRLERNQGKS